MPDIGKVALLGVLITQKNPGERWRVIRVGHSLLFIPLVIPPICPLELKCWKSYLYFSPLPGHPFSFQPYLPTRKGETRKGFQQGKLGWWRGARRSLLAGKLDVTAITYCPCSYPAYAREKSFVNKCEGADSKNLRLHRSASNTIMGHWFSIGLQQPRLPRVLNYHIPRAFFGIQPRRLTKSSMLHL